MSRWTLGYRTVKSLEFGLHWLNSKTKYALYAVLNSLAKALKLRLSIMITSQAQLETYCVYGAMVEKEKYSIWLVLPAKEMGSDGYGDLSHTTTGTLSVFTHYDTRLTKLTLKKEIVVTRSLVTSVQKLRTL